MMDIIDRYIIDCLDDISKINIIYTCLLVATANSLTFFDPIEFYLRIRMSFNTTITNYLAPIEFSADYEAPYHNQHRDSSHQRPSLVVRMAKRLSIYMDNVIAYIQTQFNEHTATSIASCSVLIIVLSIIGCFIISLMREEEKRIKEQYKKLQAGSSQSFIAVGQNNNNNLSPSTKVHDCFNDFTKVYQKSSFNQFHSGGYQQIVERQDNSHQKRFASKNALNATSGYSDPSSAAVAAAAAAAAAITSSTHLLYNHQTHNNQSSQQHQQQHHYRSDKQVRLIELRRETYFGLVRLSKPGCRTIVLLCDAQSKAKLLSKFYQCVYPYRKNKSLQFAYLLIERNIGWYKDLLKSALSEKRYFRINPINCIGTVLVLNGFKKYFSVYHASNARWSSPDDPPFLLLEEALLDNLPEWLERVFAGKVNRYYVESWPDRVQYTY
uniref:DnaJ subfamily C member 16 n=1 Tax=Aceria tosichella TaxID=561515 RepID=A0A6G1SLJ6_9ACAR